jgi:hypothetical protein
MEAKARQIILRYCPECMDGSTAVPIEKLAEQAFGLEIEYQNLTKRGDKILGKLICTDGLTPYYDMDLKQYALMEVRAKTIMVESRLADEGNRGRYRFTVAHELAHWILHREQIIQMGREAAFDEDLHDGKMERQADYLSSALLMPLGAVKMRFYSMRGNGVNGNTAVAGLAEHFIVSKQAMRIRLESHRLI